MSLSRLRYADTLFALGDVEMESEHFSEAAAEYEKCLQIREVRLFFFVFLFFSFLSTPRSPTDSLVQKLFEPTARSIVSTHFALGLAYAATDKAWEQV